MAQSVAGQSSSNSLKQIGNERPANVIDLGNLKAAQPPLSRSKEIFELKLINDQYLGSGQSYFRKDAAAQDTTLQLKIDYEKKWNSTLFSRLSVKNKYSAEERWNYFSPQQAYVAWNSADFGSGSLGRKLYKWSEVDEVWGLGIYQSRAYDDKINPESLGLIGWFTDFKMGKWKATLAVLPIFIPDIGPHHTIEGDRFVSKNPWFNPPPSRYNLGNGQGGDIRYSVKYSALDIVSNPGFVLKFENRVRTYDLRMAIGYKPMNQVLLGFPSYGKVVVGAGGDYMNVTVVPRVAYQKLASGDVGFKLRQWQVVGSFVGELPDRAESSELETAQQVKDALVASLGMSRPLGLDISEAPRVEFGFLRVWGGDAEDKGYFASKDQTLFERRFNFIEAFSLGLSKRFRISKIILDIRGRGIVDTMQNGASLALNSSLELDPKWRLSLNLESLGLIDQAGRVRDGFFNSYRSNDRMSLGMSYVF